MAADITTFPITTKKLSELASIGAVADLDVVYVLDVSTGQSRKTTVASLLALAPGSTNLSITGLTATTVTVASDTGTDAVIPAATPSTAGLMRATDRVKLEHISVASDIDLDDLSSTLGDTVADLAGVEAKTDYITVTQPVNLDTMESDETALITLSGVSAGATNLGTFTGTTIPDSRKDKEALQSLETAYEETDANVNDLITLSGRPENSTNLGVFTGTIIPDNTTVKSALQSLESNSALNDFSAVTAPVVTDDSDSGFSIGSVMVDIVTDKSYVCLDATVGAAVWKETTNNTNSTNFPQEQNLGTFRPAGTSGTDSQSLLSSISSTDGDVVFSMYGDSEGNYSVTRHEKDVNTGMFYLTHGPTGFTVASSTPTGKLALLGDYIYMIFQKDSDNLLKVKRINALDLSGAVDMTVPSVTCLSGSDAFADNTHIYIRLSGTTFTQFSVSGTTLTATGTTVTGAMAGTGPSWYNDNYGVVYMTDGSTINTYTYTTTFSAVVTGYAIPMLGLGYSDTSDVKGFCYVNENVNYLAYPMKVSGPGTVSDSAEALILKAFSVPE
jgi:hypothetical protein